MKYILASTAMPLPQCCGHGRVSGFGGIRGADGEGSSIRTTLFSTWAFRETRGFFPLAVVSPRTVTFWHRLYGKGESAGSLPPGLLKRYIPW